VALLSWLAWLVLVAASMSGQPLASALDPSLLDLVLRQTRFGHVWGIRLALMLWLALVLAWTPRRAHAERDPVGLLLLLGVLVSQVWAGHASAAPASHIANDAVHVLGAALWLGNLPPLFLLLARAGRDGAWLALAATAARRFSPVGMVAVGLLAVTGFINGQMMVGSVQALTTTTYGRLVVAKLVLLAAMLAVAAINRFRLTPRIERVATSASAARALWRNVAAEIVLGVVLLAIVGVLGGSQPPPHGHGMDMQQPMPMD
jgi:putative copper resistance protein D